MKVSTSLTPADHLPVLLERIDRREKSARSRAVLFSLRPVALTVVILSIASPGLILAETLKTAQMLGGTVVATSGFIPIFLSRRDKIVALRSMLHSYQHQHVGGLSPDAKLDQCFDRYFAKVLGD